MNIPEFYRHLNIFKYQIIKFFNTQYYCVADLVGRTGTSGEKILVDSYYAFGLYPTAQQGGWYFVYDTTKAKSNHNGITVISPTVPWAGTQATVAAFQAGTGETDSSGSGCWVLKSDELNIFMAGAVGDGSTDDTTAKTNAEAITTYNYVFWPKTTSFYVLTSAPTLSKSWGDGTLKISGSQIYLHPKREKVEQIYVSVFNPPVTPTSSGASAAIQAAIDIAQENNLPVSFPPGKDYRIDTGLTFKHGKSSSDTTRYHVKVIGNSVTIRPNSGVTAMSIVPRCTFADRATGRGVGDIQIDGIIFDGFYSPTNGIGLVIGQTNMHCTSTGWNSVKNITFQSFNNANPVFKLVECRHTEFQRVKAAVGAPMVIETVATGSFCGDFRFISCELAGNNAQPAWIIRATGDNSQVRGIKFLSVDTYGNSNQMISSGTGSQVGDIWFDAGCQVEGSTSQAGEIPISLLASGNLAQIFGIHFINIYIKGFDAALIKAETTGNATCMQMEIKGGQLGDSTGDAGSANCLIYLKGVEQFDMQGVTFDDVRATQVVYVEDSTNVNTSNNTVTNSSGSTTYFATFAGTTDKYTAINNSANVSTAVINDVAMGATKLIDPNLLVP